MHSIFRTYVLLFILLLTGIDSFAQSTLSIRGIVMDSIQNKTLQSATINLFSVSSNSPVAKTITNESGVFLLQIKDTGTYIIESSFTGFVNHRDTVVIDKDTDLGKISLHEKSKTLTEVSVTAQKKLIEQTDDKIIYNVENDPLAKSQTAIDILRKTPFVSVDGDNNVRVNGQSNFRVLLNGRETAMFAQNVKEALQGFPGGSIMKIEVITNPSAKYDAEGIGGLINIITKKKIEGYNGSVSTWTTTIKQMVLNTNFNAKINKIGVTVNYGTSANIGIRSFYTSHTTPLGTAIYSSRLLEGDRKATSYWNFGNAELSWQLDSLSALSFFGNISGGNSKVVLAQQITTAYSNTSSPYTSNFDQANRRQYPTNTIGADYIKKYASNPGKEFSLRINAELGHSNSFLESDEISISANRFTINNSIATNKQYTLQSDFINPFNERTKIELGARATLRRATSDFESQIKYNSSENFKINPANSDNFSFFQDVLSAYGSLSFKINTINIRTGIRVEQTVINGDFQSGKGFAKNSYLNILPNLQLSTKIKDLALVVSYNQRLQRPYISYLNPFIENNDSLNISFGNPGLDAQTIHTITLQSRLQKGNTFMGLTFSSSYSNNMIVSLVTFNSANGIRSTTYRNVGRDFLYSVNGNINTKFGKDWSFNAGINFQYRTVSNKEMPSQYNRGMGGNTNAGVTWVVNPKFTATTYAGFEKSIIDLQSSPSIIPYCGTGVTYQVVQNKLRIGLMGQNYFAKYYDYTTRIKGSSFETLNINETPFSKLVLTVNWNFGKLKEKVSKRRGVTNDDLLGNAQ